MKATKEQKLRWIDRVLRRLEKQPCAFSCWMFAVVGGDAARDWYVSTFKAHQGENILPSHFDELPHDTAEDCRQARIFYVSFLHLWISEGVLE